MRSKSQNEMVALNLEDLFMWQVLLQKNPDEQRAKQYCALCNFDYDATRICITIEYPTLGTAPIAQRRNILEKQRAYMNRRLADHNDSKKLILIRENSLTILRTVPNDMPRIAVILEHELLGAQIVQDIPETRQVHGQGASHQTETGPGILPGPVFTYRLPLRQGGMQILFWQKGSEAGVYQTAMIPNTIPQNTMKMLMAHSHLKLNRK